MRRANKYITIFFIFFWFMEKIIKVFRDYSYLLSEVKYKAKHGKGLKILTPKQMLQRLLISLTQMKPGNTSENLLDELGQIIHSLYQTK